MADAPEPYRCSYRQAGFTNCHCARFDDMSCVPPHLYPEFARRRDASAPGDRSFADRRTYETPIVFRPAGKEVMPDAPAAPAADHATSPGVTPGAMDAHGHWRVTVETGTDQIVCIETECLSGREISDADEATIREAAHHLLAFIGESTSTDAQALAHPLVADLVALLDRTVAMIARGKVIERQAERVARKGGSATPVMWAAEAYDVLLDDLDRDTRAALARIRAAQEGGG